jgi:LPXTG-motif cell wall-anchored protein
VKLIRTSSIIATIALSVPLGLVSAASADPVYMSSCTFAPSSLTLGPGDSEVVNLTADARGAWSETTFDGTVIPGGGPFPVGSNGTTPITMIYENVSNYVNSATGTYVLTLTPTDGMAQISAVPMCALTVELVQTDPTSTTTNTAPVTLPRTGSSMTKLLFGGVILVVFGGALVVSSRRRGTGGLL